METLNRVLRNTPRTKGFFPIKDIATGRILLAIRNFEKGGRADRERVAARKRLVMMFAGRFDA